jgi:hypothetical protein
MCKCTSNSTRVYEFDVGNQTNGVSQNNPDDEIGPSTVTLSAAKGLSRWAARCFAALSMTVL